MQLFSPFSDQSEHTFQTSSSWAKKARSQKWQLVGRVLVMNFTQRIVQNWNLMRRFLVTNATIQLPEVITLSFTLKVYMMELFTSANIAHHILHTKERGHWQNTSFISIQKHFSLVLIRNASLKHSTNKLWKCTPNQSTKALFATNVIQWIAVTKQMIASV